MLSRHTFAFVLALAVAAAGLSGAAQAAAPKAKVTKKAFTVRGTAPGAEAKLTGVRVSGKGRVTTWRELKLRVRSDNAKWSKAMKVSGKGAQVSYTKPMVQLGDLNGDVTPDVWVTGFTGGAHCCTTMATAFSTGPNSWAKPKTTLWLHGFTAKDLDGDGTVEVIADDGRFDYAFTSHAGSSWPVVIQKARGTAFYDASTSYPKLLRGDADEMRSRWKTLKRDPGAARAALAAGLADLIRLGALDEARGWVSEAKTRGDLDAQSDDIFDVAVGAKLVEWGYLTDYATIGLPG